MDKALKQAEPFFSQPVRQVILMLIVTGLVGAGGYFAYSAIASVFFSNPWLNGVILGVFLLGILTCFWQVVQLAKSVSWIEDFAAARPGHEATVPPVLLAPLAALLRSRGSRGQISPSSARSMLDSVEARIEEGRDITRYLANLLIFLGLLGTFYGLATTVPAVVDTIRALAPQDGETGVDIFDRLMRGLESQLGGMGTAFSSSLLGLAGSLVIGLLELFAGHGQNRFYRELEEWLSSITRLSFAGGEGDGLDQATIAHAFDRMAEEMQVLEDIFARTDAGRIETDARLGQLAGAVEALTGRIGTEIAARSQTEAALAAALGRLAEGQERMAASLAAHLAASASEREANGPTGPDAESRMRLRSIDVQLLRLLEEVSAGRQESMAELRAELSALTRAVRQLRPEAPSPLRRG